MTDSFEHERFGEWHRTGADPVVAGRLRFGSSPAELHTMRALPGLDDAKLGHVIRTIHGMDLDGEHYTLVDSRLGSGGISGSPQRWHPDAVLQSAWLPGPVPRFDQMLLHLDGLEYFAGSPYVDITHRSEHGVLEQLEVTAARSVKLTGRVSDCDVALITAPMHTGGGPSTTVSFRTHFRVTSDAPRAWKWFVEGPLSRLVDLIRFALTVPVAVDRVQLRSTDHRTDGVPTVVDLELPFMRSRERRHVRDWMAGFECLLQADGAPADCLERWDRCVEELTPVPTLLMAPANSPHIYTEHRFSTLAMATELLAKRLGLCSPERRQNHSTFERRVHAVLDAVPPITEHLDTWPLAQQVRQMRNAVSHGDINSPGWVDVPDRHSVGQLLVFATSWHLLRRIVADADASERVAQHKEFRHVLEQLASDRPS